jgi:hypothetical protein
MKRATVITQVTQLIRKNVQTCKLAFYLCYFINGNIVKSQNFPLLLQVYPTYLCTVRSIKK